MPLTFSRKWLRFWVLLAGVILALLVFEEIADDVFQDPHEGDHEAQSFDQAIFRWSGQFRTPILTQAMTDLTALGSVSVVLMMFVVLASVLVSYRDYRGLSYLTVVLAGAGLWPTLLKTTNSYLRKAGVEVQGITDRLGYKLPEMQEAKVLSLRNSQ